MPPQAIADDKFMARIEADLVSYELSDGTKWYLLNVMETTTYAQVFCSPLKNTCRKAVLIHLMDSKEMEATGEFLEWVLIQSPNLTAEKMAIFAKENAWDTERGVHAPFEQTPLDKALYADNVSPVTVLQTDNGKEFKNQGNCSAKAWSV